MSINETNCCGIRELDGISQPYNAPRKIVEEVIYNRFNEEELFSMVNFTNNEKNKAGYNLEKYILKHKLGRVFKTPIIRNPNSGNKIRQWTWVLDAKAMFKYMRTYMYSDYEDFIEMYEYKETITGIINR